MGDRDRDAAGQLQPFSLLPEPELHVYAPLDLISTTLEPKQIYLLAATTQAGSALSPQIFFYPLAV